MSRPYKAYEFKNQGKTYGRVRGPNKLDIGILCACAGCYALYMNIAYEEGRKSCGKKKA